MVDESALRLRRTAVEIQKMNLLIYGSITLTAYFQFGLGTLLIRTV